MYEAKATPAATATSAAKPRDLPRPKPVTVNGVTIPRDAIAREVQNHPAAKPIDAWFMAARALVVRELLFQEARRLELVAEPRSDDEGRRETDDEAIVRALVEREITVPDADDDTCRRYFENNRQRFRSSDLFAVRHILCAAAPEDAAGRIEALQLAEQIIAELERDPALFAALAQAHSACPSRDVGGSLGQISHGQTVPEFERALAALPVGTVARTPVETRYGFHIVQVDHRIDGEPLPFEVVHTRIAAWLHERAHHTAVRQYISMLAGRATITGIEIDAQASPLVQ
ncbi:MAG: peptidylprolyl isomerase [Hyphomicrobiaceae bacterium]